MDERGIVNLTRNITIKYITGKCNFISTLKNFTRYIAKFRIKERKTFNIQKI